MIKRLVHANPNAAAVPLSRRVSGDVQYTSFKVSQCCAWKFTVTTGAAQGHCKYRFPAWWLDSGRTMCWLQPSCHHWQLAHSCNMRSARDILAFLSTDIDSDGLKLLSNLQLRLLFSSAVSGE